MEQINKLKKLRKDKKITIKELANILDITPSYYWQLENDKKRLFYEMAIKISYIYNMKPDEIFYTKYHK